MPDGLALTVRLTPRGGRDAVDGIATLGDGRCALKIRVRSAPADGEANDALTRVVAKTLGVAPRMVRLTAGATSRLKTLHVSGDARTFIAALESLCREVH